MFKAKKKFPTFTFEKLCSKLLTFNLEKEGRGERCENLSS
jgi:hypothetical protein